MATPGAFVLPPGWTLTGLPPAIISEFEAIAREVIRRRLVPAVWLRFHRRRRQKLLAAWAAGATRRPHNQHQHQHHHLPQRNTPSASPLSTTLLQSSDLLASWPEHILQEMTKSASFVVFEHGEIVAHQQEPCARALVLLISGVLEVFTRSPELTRAAAKESATRQSAASSVFTRSRLSADLIRDSFARRAGLRLRSKGLCATAFAGRVWGPAALVDFAILSDEPHLHYLVSSGECVLGVVPQDALLAGFQQLPVALAQRIASAAMEKRRATLPLAFPMTEGRIRRCQLFAALSTADIEAIAARLVPRAFARGELICERGKVAAEMLFVRRGLVGMREATGRRVTLRDGVCLLATETALREPVAQSLVAVTNVDAYALHYGDLQAVRGLSEQTRAMIDDASQEQRRRRLQASAQDTTSAAASSADGAGAGGAPPATAHSFALQASTNTTGSSAAAAWIRAIPILSLLGPLSDDLVGTLAAKLRPRPLSARQQIVNAADQCDRLLFVSRGSGIVRNLRLRGKPQLLHNNEWIGYTCVLQHRWTFTIHAAEPVDVWELERADYVATLKQHGLYHRVVGGAVQLMQPLLPFAHRIPELELVSVAVPSPNSFPSFKTPNMHPVSSNDRTFMYPPWRDASEVCIFGFRGGVRRSAATPATAAAVPGQEHHQHQQQQQQYVVGRGAAAVGRWESSRGNSSATGSTWDAKSAKRGFSPLCVAEAVTRCGAPVFSTMEERPQAQQYSPADGDDETADDEEGEGGRGQIVSSSQRQLQPRSGGRRAGNEPKGASHPIPPVGARQGDQQVVEVESAVAETAPCVDTFGNHVPVPPARRACVGSAHLEDSVASPSNSLGGVVRAARPAPTALDQRQGKQAEEDGDSLRAATPDSVDADAAPAHSHASQQVLSPCSPLGVTAAAQQRLQAAVVRPRKLPKAIAAHPLLQQQQQQQQCPRPPPPPQPQEQQRRWRRQVVFQRPRTAPQRRNDEKGDARHLSRAARAGVVQQRPPTALSSWPLSTAAPTAGVGGFSMEKDLGTAATAADVKQRIRTVSSHVAAHATTVSETYGGSLLRKSGAAANWGITSVAVSPRHMAVRWVARELESADVPL